MKKFERKIIQELLEACPDIHYSLKDEYREEKIEYSGVGYFLTIKDELLPINRFVLSTPYIGGTLDGISVGYLAFIENHELMLECHVNVEESVNPKHRNNGFIQEKT